MQFSMFIVLAIHFTAWQIYSIKQFNGAAYRPVLASGTEFRLQDMILRVLLDRSHKLEIAMTPSCVVNSQASNLPR